MNRDPSGGDIYTNTTQVGGSHYIVMPVQPWQVMKSVLTHEEFVGFLKGNCLKYAMRAGHKGGDMGRADDLAKYDHYAAKLKEVASHGEQNE